MTAEERREFDRRGEEIEYLKKCLSVKNNDIKELEKEIRRLKGEPEPPETFIRVIK